MALDLFPTDTTALADYVLPAASFLEFDDLIASVFPSDAVAPRSRSMPPLGEALPNLEIFRRLARAMGFAEPEFRESDARDSGAPAGGERARRGFRVAQGRRARSGFRRSRPRNSRTGCSIRRAGASRSRARAPRRTASRGCRNAGAIRALRPAICGCCRRRMRGCSTPASATWARSARVSGPASIALHPADAAERRLREGEIALVHNACGRLNLKVDDVGRVAARRRAGA